MKILIIVTIFFVTGNILAYDSTNTRNGNTIVTRIFNDPYDPLIDWGPLGGPVYGSYYEEEVKLGLDWSKVHAETDTEFTRIEKKDEYLIDLVDKDEALGSPLTLTDGNRMLLNSHLYLDRQDQDIDSNCGVDYGVVVEASTNTETSAVTFQQKFSIKPKYDFSNITLQSVEEKINLEMKCHKTILKLFKLTLRNSITLNYKVVEGTIPYGDLNEWSGSSLGNSEKNKKINDSELNKEESFIGRIQAAFIKMTSSSTKE